MQRLPPTRETAYDSCFYLHVMHTRALHQVLGADCDSRRIFCHRALTSAIFAWPGHNHEYFRTEHSVALRSRRAMRLAKLIR